MIKVSDYIIKFLENQGIRHVFMFDGGMSMHINDSVGYASKLKPVFMLHEQGCTFAAEAYARATNNLGVVVTTCGPGATNTLTGVACSWIESTPLLVITGQCKRADLAMDPALRQYGVQEVRITEMAKPVTKYTKVIKNPESIRYELEKAVYLCQSGRPGPVLLDIPVDVQGAKVDENALIGFFNEYESKPKINPDLIDEVVQLINSAKRPVLYASAGVSIAEANEKFIKLAEKLDIPVLLNWNGMDILDNEHPLYSGRPGAIGHRAANFTLQTADLLICIGTRLSLLQTGFNFDGFAKNAKLVMVDIDEAELNKPNIHPDIKIYGDAHDFISTLLHHPELKELSHPEWKKQTKLWMKEYPPIKDEWWLNKDYVNSFCLLDRISDKMNADDIYVGGRAGTCVDAAIQAFKVKKNQRVFVTKGLSSMGNGLPAAIGTAYATERRIVSVIGDGGFVMNSQELEVIRRDNLPVKLFVLNNKGYGTIINTQRNVFDGHFVGCTPDSGLTLGNIRKIAEAYGIKTYSISCNDEMDEIIEKAFADLEPCLVDVNVDPFQPIEPRQASYKTPEGSMASRPLEDMKPLLPPEEIERIMSISK